MVVLHDIGLIMFINDTSISVCVSFRLLLHV